MNLEELNKEYVKLKADLEQARKNIEATRIKVSDLEGDKIIQQAEKVKAKRNSDKVAEQVAEDEIKRIEDEVKKVMNNAKEQKGKMIELQRKIYEKVEEIKKNPEMKAHLDEVLAKKYDRKISKLENEKEELTGKKFRLENLQKLVTNHPALGNNLKGIIVAQKEIDVLQKELDDMKTTDQTTGTITYADPARANEIMNTLIPNAQNKITTNKTPLMTYITKKSLNITEQDIDDLVANKPVLDSKGNLVLDATINRNISKYNRQIKGLDKSIKDHKIALSKHDITNTITDPNTPAPSNGPTTQTSAPSNGPVTQTVNPENKPKWYQFVKRFQNWNERRKQQALPTTTTTTTTTPTPQPKENEFKNSLKYEVVADIVKAMEEDEKKVAKAERKAEQQTR